MAQQVIFHNRFFSKVLQDRIKKECDANHYIWRDFEKVDLVMRELQQGQLKAESMLPKSLRKYVRYTINPFDYSISFYLSIGYED